MDDVLTLVRRTYTTDAVGNKIPEEEKRQVFCRVRSVTRSEFYQAAQTDLQPEIVFVLSTFRDYEGEPDILYTDWTGKERRYSVLRTYRIPDSDELELTATERIGDRGDSDG